METKKVKNVSVVHSKKYNELIVNVKKNNLIE